MKILENPTRERNHKLYGIGKERINTVPFSSGFLMTQTPMNLFKVCNELNGVQFSFHRSQATELQAGSVLCFRIPLV